MDLTTTNGYATAGSPNHHQMSGSNSPGMMRKHSPPPQRNNLRVNIPSRNDLPVSEDGGLSDEVHSPSSTQS